MTEMLLPVGSWSHLCCTGAPFLLFMFVFLFVLAIHRFLPSRSCGEELEILIICTKNGTAFFNRTNSNVVKLPQIEILRLSDPSTDCSLHQPLRLQQHGLILETPLHVHKFPLTESGRTKPSENEAQDCHQFLKLKSCLLVSVSRLKGRNKVKP